MIVGNTYHVTDFLCPARATPHILEQDFVSSNGIVIPEGTIVPLRSCAYMQRFDFSFAIDNSLDLKEYIGPIADDYGFSVLYPRTKGQ